MNYKFGCLYFTSESHIPALTTNMMCHDLSHDSRHEHNLNTLISSKIFNGSSDNYLITIIFCKILASLLAAFVYFPQSSSVAGNIVRLRR